MPTYIANSLTVCETSLNLRHLCMSECKRLYKFAPVCIIYLFHQITLHISFISSTPPLSPHLSLCASVTPHRAPFSPFIILFLPEHFQFQAPPFFSLFTFIIHRFFNQCVKRAPQTQIKPANLTGIKPKIKVNRFYLYFLQLM